MNIKKTVEKNFTPQEHFWRSSFGQTYTRRNLVRGSSVLDKEYIEKVGRDRSKMNRDFLRELKIKNILEAGCNMGSQLILLQSQGYKNLYGFDIQPEAVETAKKYTKNINIIQASIFDIPFRDKYFDLVFTTGVLIHISPKDIRRAMKEICRVSKKYIWGYEYFNDDYVGVEYRGNKDRLWKGNFSKMYLNLFPDLELVKERKYKYLENNNIDTMFLLRKK